jgi:hydrogenase maturation protease
MVPVQMRNPRAQRGSGLSGERTIAMTIDVCIACVGNELAGDDGVGMRMGRILQLLPLPAGTCVRFYPQVDLDLIDDLLAAQRFVLCDATRTGSVPGTVSVLKLEDITQFSRQPYCCHGIGLSELVLIATELGPPDWQWDVHLVGVEAQSVDEFGTELSSPVQAALPDALRHVLRLIGAPEELISVAQAEARRVPAPSALLAFGG